ncbi:MAG: hypothetical protein Tsb0014_15070 [Pleurocapsa sp.]
MLAPLIFERRNGRDDLPIDLNLDSNQFLGRELGQEQGQGIVKKGTPKTMKITCNSNCLLDGSALIPQDKFKPQRRSFQPLVDFITENQPKLIQETWFSKSSSENYQKLTKAIANLAHLEEYNYGIST